jgi:hypothetical protein
MDMESKNAQFLRQGMIDRCRKMTPAERVKAFIDHSKRMKSLATAGEARRKSLRAKKTGEA